jgi:transposase
MVRPLMASDRGTQPTLLPTDARDLLAADHAAWQYLGLVAELDLTAFYAAYRGDGRGRPPYDPAMMVALLLYCASKGHYEAKDIQTACRDDLGCRVITGNRFPDDGTIGRFRIRHALALRGLLARSLRLCDAAGLVDLDLIAGDGTKIAANAAMDATIDEATLRARIADLRALVAERDAAWQASVTAGEAGQLALPGLPSQPPTGHGPAWRLLLRARAALAAHEAALAQLLAEPGSEHTAWQERLERDQARVATAQARLSAVRERVQATHTRRAQRQAAGQSVPGPRPVPVDEHCHVRQATKALATATARAAATAVNPPPRGKVNITDPSSRIMPGKRGGYDQMFNVEVCACPGQIILAIIRHPNTADTQALPELLWQARANADAAGIHRRFGTALFDAGYPSQANFTADLPVATLLVALPPATAERPHPEAWQPMADRLTEPTNRAAYTRRSPIIEPVFAQLFNHFGRDPLTRGDAVDTELHLWATSHNLAKLLRHRARNHQQTAGNPPD